MKHGWPGSIGYGPGVPMDVSEVDPTAIESVARTKTNTKLWNEGDEEGWPDVTGLSNSATIHLPLLSSAGVTTDPVYVATYLRRYIDRLPETRASFTFAGALTSEADRSEKNGEKESADQLRRAVYRRRRSREEWYDVIRLAGSWPVANYYTGDKKFANPNYVHAESIPEVEVRCQCGAPVVLLKKDKRQVTPLGRDVDQHNDDCRKIWRQRARLEAAEQRREIALKAIRFGISGKDFQARVARNRTSSEWIRDMGIDPETERERARDRIANTTALLMTDYPTHIAGEIYDLSAGYLRRMVKERTPADPVELRKYRESTRSRADGVSPLSPLSSREYGGSEAARAASSESSD